MSPALLVCTFTIPAPLITFIFPHCCKSRRTSFRYTSVNYYRCRISWVFFFSPLHFTPVSVSWSWRLCTDAVRLWGSEDDLSSGVLELTGLFALLWCLLIILGVFWSVVVASTLLPLCGSLIMANIEYWLDVGIILLTGRVRSFLIFLGSFVSQEYLVVATSQLLFTS